MRQLLIIVLLLISGGALMAAGHYLAAEEIFWLGVMCFLPIVFRIAKFLRDFR